MNSQVVPVFTAKAATGNSDPIMVTGMDTIVFQAGTSGSANMTIKIKGSANESSNAPTFSSAASISNQWFYVESIDLVSQDNIISGSTGLVWSGADAVRGVEVNVNKLNWVQFEITALSAGAVTAICSITQRV